MNATTSCCAHDSKVRSDHSLLVTLDNDAYSQTLSKTPSWYVKHADMVDMPLIFLIGSLARMVFNHTRHVLLLTVTADAQRNSNYCISRSTCPTPPNTIFLCMVETRPRPLQVVTFSDFATSWNYTLRKGKLATICPEGWLCHNYFGWIEWIFCLKFWVLCSTLWCIEWVVQNGPQELILHITHLHNLLENLPSNLPSSLAESWYCFWLWCRGCGRGNLVSFQ